MKIEVGIEDANAIAVDCMKEYYIDLLDNGVYPQALECIYALDVVLSHFMTPHQYEDFNNGLRQNTLSL